MSETYVWLGICFISQFHDGCKLLAVSPLMYAQPQRLACSMSHGFLSGLLLTSFADIHMEKHACETDLFSILQFHDDCKLLAVNFIYVYNASAYRFHQYCVNSVLFIAVNVYRYMHGKPTCDWTFYRLYKFTTVGNYSILNSHYAYATAADNVFSISLVSANVVCRFFCVY